MIARGSKRDLDSTYVSTSLDLAARTCLTDAAALLSMTRAGTKLFIYDPSMRSREAWECVSTGRPAAWLVAEQRRYDEELRAEFARERARKGDAP
jgi:hypothetical protein